VLANNQTQRESKGAPKVMFWLWGNGPEKWELLPDEPLGLGWCENSGAQAKVETVGITQYVQVNSHFGSPQNELEVAIFNCIAREHDADVWSERHPCALTKGDAGSSSRDETSIPFWTRGRNRTHAAACAMSRGPQ